MVPSYKKRQAFDKLCPQQGKHKSTWDAQHYSARALGDLKNHTVLPDGLSKPANQR